MIESLLQVYKEHKLPVWLLILFLPISILIVGSIILPDIFWDSFIWKFFWGPVVADAEGEAVNGLSAGYNIVNTITYGLILTISFFGIKELIDHFEITLDKKFVYALLPWIVLGGSLRSLEDVGLFKGLLVKLTISPSIYFLLGFSAITLMIIGAWLSKLELNKIRSVYVQVLVLTPIPFIYLFIARYLTHFSIYFFIVLFAVMTLSLLAGTREFELNEKYLFFTYGLTAISITLSYNAYYILYREGTNALEVALIPMIGLGLTTLFLISLKGIDYSPVFASDTSLFQIFTRPLNLLICSAHLVDASSTYRGIAAYGYSEKHVLPTFMINLFGPAVIFILKISLIILIIYSLDKFLKEDFSDSGELKVLLKFVIIVLGFSPSIRNILRLAMGV